MLLATLYYTLFWVKMLKKENDSIEPPSYFLVSLFNLFYNNYYNGKE